MADINSHADLDQAAIHDMLNSADGPVGRLLEELDDQIVSVARSVVRVRRPGSDRTGATSNARAPGVTLASIKTHLGWDDEGAIYGGANAVADPAIFLEDPAEQLDTRYPFLTTGLDSLDGLL